MLTDKGNDKRRGIFRVSATPQLKMTLSLSLSLPVVSTVYNEAMMLVCAVNFAIFFLLNALSESSALSANPEKHSAKSLRDTRQ